MQPSDIASLVTVTRIEITADDGLLLALRRPDTGKDRYAETIVGYADGQLHAVTDGDEDSFPLLSPDGTRLAFLRRRDGRPQVTVLDITSAEISALAATPCGVEDLVWSPDGRSLIVTARHPLTPADTPLGHPARRIEAAKWRLNGAGIIFDRPRMLARLSLDGALDWLDLPAAEWSSPFFDDRDVLHAVSDAHPGADHDNRRDLYRIDGDLALPLTPAGTPVEVLAAAAHPGGGIALLFRDMGPDGRAYAGTNAAVGVLRDETITVLSDPLTTDLGADAALSFGPDGEILTTSRHRGLTTLVHASAKAGIRDVAGGPLAVTAHACARRSGRLFVAGATHDSGATLMEIALENGEVLRTTRLDPRVPAARIPEEHEFRTRDGHSVHGWVVSPDGTGPHPVILLVHGGPFAQHTPTLFDEAQVLAAAGFAVLLCNPRGSAGYGQDHARAVIGRLGAEDADDVIDFLDGALTADPRLDAQRVGIMGGSYGGFLSAWILGHDHRFAGGLLERGWFDPESMVGTSDIGSFYVDAYMGPTAADRARTRPLDVAHLASCPVLVMHSDDDLRCPISQSEAYVAARRRRGLPVEFVVFPGENHELSRSGTPRHREERFEIIVDWWRRVFSGAVAPAASAATTEEGWR